MEVIRVPEESTTNMNRVALVNKLCKAVGIKRNDDTDGYLSRRELVHLLGWISAADKKG